METTILGLGFRALTSTFDVTSGLLLDDEQWSCAEDKRSKHPRPVLTSVGGGVDEGVVAFRRCKQAQQKVSGQVL